MNHFGIPGPYIIPELVIKLHYYMYINENTH